MNNKTIHASILTIGDEILIGQIIDTNSAWLGQELGKMGIRVSYRMSVGDDKNHILHALFEAEQKADVIFITGGLGPTKDDVTKETLCSYFDTRLILHQPTLEWVTQIFRQRNLPLLESNRLQAMIPELCTVLHNRSGTAPGMAFQKNQKVFFSLPGVPFEMKTLFEDHCKKIIEEQFTLPVIIHRTIQTASIGESFLAEKIADWENNLPAHIRLAYLPSVGQVRLRLSGYGSDASLLQHEMSDCIKNLYAVAGSYIYGEENDTLQSVVGHLLKNKKQTLATAESCTGGYLAHLITSVPGSSAYYTGSIISYANEIKTKQLGVSEAIIRQHGAVSEACVRQMADGVRELLGTDYAIATSGIAGPDGGTPEKPVGMVWIAVSSKNKTTAQVFQLGDNRERTIQRAALQGLDLLRRMIASEAS